MLRSIFEQGLVELLLVAETVGGEFLRQLPQALSGGRIHRHRAIARLHDVWRQRSLRRRILPRRILSRRILSRRILSRRILTRRLLRRRRAARRLTGGRCRCRGRRSCRSARAWLNTRLSVTTLLIQQILQERPHLHAEIRQRKRQVKVHGWLFKLLAKALKLALPLLAHRDPLPLNSLTVWILLLKLDLK